MKRSQMFTMFKTLKYITLVVVVEIFCLKFVFNFDSGTKIVSFFDVKIDI